MGQWVFHTDIDTYMSLWLYDIIFVAFTKAKKPNRKGKWGDGEMPLCLGGNERGMANSVLCYYCDLVVWVFLLFKPWSHLFKLLNMFLWCKHNTLHSWHAQNCGCFSIRKPKQHKFPAPVCPFSAIHLCSKQLSSVPLCCPILY